MAKSNNKKDKPKTQSIIPVASSTLSAKTKKGPYNQRIEDNINRFSKEKLLFSFRFFDRNHQNYNLGKTEVSWFVSVLDRLKDMSDIEMSDFNDPHFRERMRIHPNDFTEQELVHIPKNFIQQFSESGDFYQLNISQAKGRIHGFKIDNTFFIVWLDRHHNKIPMDNHGGLKIFKPTLSEYEILESDLNRCKKDNEELYVLLDEKMKEL